jgi:hypothetical protein
MRLILLTATVIACLSSFADSTGTVGGTVVFVSGDVPALHVGSYGSGVTFSIVCNRKQFDITADENGDFQISLPSGSCRLIRALDRQHHEIPIDKTQARNLVVRKGGHTRFDVMLRKSTD